MAVDAGKEEAKFTETQKNRIKIGIITTWYNRGLSYLSRFLAKCLQEKYDAYIFAYDKYIIDPQDEFFKKTTFCKEKNFEDIKKWIDEENINVVFTPEKLIDSDILHWCKQRNVPTILIPIFETIKKDKVRHYNEYTALLCPVKCTYDLLSKIGVNNVHFVPWGIDTSIYTPASKKAESPIRFIHNAGWGGAEWRKNSEAVLTAFDKACKKNDTIELLFKSQLPLDKYPEKVQKIEKENNRIIVNDNNVPLKELIEIHHSCHVSLLPSKWEGIGLPFIESLSMGLPVITVDAPPMNEWIKNDHNGYCCKIDNWVKRSNTKNIIKGALVNVDDYADQILRFSNHKLVEEMRLNAINSAKNIEDIFRSKINDFLDALLPRSLVNTKNA
jgi:glycosyltransferase involved in cell wall biosynthesis